MKSQPPRNGPVRLRRGIYLLPNLLTTAALFAGFYAVIVAMKGDFQAAAVGILTAMVLDGMDGRVARLTHTESEFGKEYDSLSDMVAFGLAPALVFYQWSLSLLPENGVAWGRLGWIAAFFFAVAAALRLARFNSKAGTGNPKFFEGLPSPSAAGFVASSLWLATEFQVTGSMVLTAGFAATIVTAGLMVSNFRYYSFKEVNIGGRIQFRVLLLVPLTIMIIALNPPLVLSCMFGGYAISGPLRHSWRRLRRRSRVAEERVAGPGADVVDVADVKRAANDRIK